MTIIFFPLVYPEQPFERDGLVLRAFSVYYLLVTTPTRGREWLDLTLRALWMTSEAAIRMIYPSKSPLKVRLMKDLSKNETSEGKLTSL